jgi:sulfatase modifying factor 1
MKTTNLFAILLTTLVASNFPVRAWSDTFGSGANTFNIAFTTIGNPGNLPDTTGTPNPAGSVSTTYRIGTYETSEQMIEKANTLGGLLITKTTRGADQPATSVSWNEAARFVNWLNTSTGSTPAYKFASQPGDAGYSASADILLWTPSDAGYNPSNLYRNSLARYFLPNVDEWYKAAYYNPTSSLYYDYPTGSDSAPTPVASGTTGGTAVYNSQAGPADITFAGGLSPYGTMGQGGNVYEWEETDFDLVNGPIVGSAPRGVRGGTWGSNSNFLSSSNRLSISTTSEINSIGFRVASTPEPSTLFLAVMASVGLLLRRRR